MSKEKHIKRLGVLLPVLLLGCSAWMLSACDLEILEVDNPNNLIEDELENPAAGTAVVNGAEASVTRALGAIYAPYSTTTDELTWIGSRDGWERLDFGELDNRRNEFTDNAFHYVGEAVWTADRAIDRMENFDEEGVIRNRIDLARAYLYGAIIYVTVADMFEDYAFSDRTEAAEPIGTGNMQSLYDDAIEYLDQGLIVAREEGNAHFESYILAMRARAHFSRDLWEVIDPASPGVDTGDPLVHSTQAVQDAQDALDVLAEDQFHVLGVSTETSGLIVGDQSMALQVNSRLEMAISEAYVRIEDERPAEVTLEDPISGETDPILDRLVWEFTDARQYADINIVSSREMHLILAESALAQGDTGGFETHINNLRDLDNLPHWDGSEISAQEMLEHARRVNLFLQGRRLKDHYRFDAPSHNWTSGTAAFEDPGTLFPITITEVRSNPHLD